MFVDFFFPPDYLEANKKKIKAGEQLNHVFLLRFLA